MSQKSAAPPKPLSVRAQREILKELLSREQALASRQAASKPSEADLEKAKALRKAMFLEQREFFFEAAREGRFRVARCTRRAGKTTGAAIKLLITLLLDPRSVSLYVAKSTTIVRDQIWPELKNLVAEHDLPFEFNETQLRLQHKRSTGRLIFRGVSDAAQPDKLRGLGVGGTFVLAILDESGTFGAEMENIVTSIISPGLRDRAGELLLIGTPGYFPDGLFYAASEGLPKYEHWVRRRWSLQANPFISAHAKDLVAIRLEEGLTGDDPRYIREWLGEYALNSKTAMFEYDPKQNGFAGPAPQGLEYILGVDFGWVDETAIVAVGYSPSTRETWAVESWAASEQDSDQVAARLVEFKSKYRPARIVGDTGGYGKGPAETIWRHYGIYIEQAKKLEKLNHLAFLNSAFRSGNAKVNLADELAKELPRVLWAENKKDAHNKAKDNRAMAHLYAWFAIYELTNKTASKRPEVPKELDGWPEYEIREKLGLGLDPTSQLAWFLEEI